MGNLKLLTMLSLSVVLLLSGCDKAAAPHNEQMKHELSHVDVALLSSVNLRLSKQLPGRIAAFNEAEVRPQVSGIIKSRHFVEGGTVKAGDVLYQIDPAVYQAKVNSAQAQVTKALADQKVLQKDLLRQTELAKRKLVSQQDLDIASADLQQAKANVAIAKADLANANIDLSYTQVKAPISGKIGLSTLSEGALVTAAQAAYLTTIRQVDTVYIDMSESALFLFNMKQEVFNSSKGYASKVPVTVALENGTQYEEQGFLNFSDSSVSPSTGSVKLRAQISNPRNELLPGMFVHATIFGPEAHDFITVDQSWVLRNQDGSPYVLTLNADNKVVKSNIVLGDEVGHQWVVNDGLVVGEKVITSNPERLKQGMEVIVDTLSGSNDNPPSQTVTPSPTTLSH